MRWVLLALMIFFFPAFLFVGAMIYVFVPELLSHWQFYVIVIIPVLWVIFVEPEPKKKDTE